MNSELDRIKFIENRDGIAAALEFCVITRKVYRQCVLRSRKRGFIMPHHASFPEYRRGFIESYLAFKCYIKHVNFEGIYE